MLTINRLVIAVAVAFGFCAAPLHAAPLAQHVPDEAIIYVAWRGADDPVADFEQTNLKQLLDLTNLDALVNQAVPGILAKYQQEMDPQTTFVMHMLAQVGPIAWDRPWAFYLTGVVPPADPWDPPMPQVGLVIDAGPHAATLRMHVQQLQMMPLPVDVTEENDIFHFAFATAPMQQPLSQHEGFQLALRHLGEDGQMVAYVNVQAAIDLMRSQLRSAHPMHGQADAEEFGQVMQTLGLNNLHAVAFNAGFHGQSWRVQAFAHAPAPRTGLVAAILNDRPVTDEQLAAVPGTASLFSACHLEMGPLLNSLREVLNIVDPQANEELDDMLNHASAMLGADIENDIIHNLGSLWLAYRDADVAGPASDLGLIIVNRVNDPQRAQNALSAMVNAVNDMTAPGQRDFPHFRFVQFQHAGTTVHSFTIPFIQPTFAVHGEQLYIAFLPQAATAAIDFAESDRPSILQNQRFVQARQRLAAQNITAINYTDLPTIAPHTYKTPLFLGQLASFAANLFHDQPDGASMPLLPTLGQLQPLLEPILGTAWVDDDGWYMTSISPFPASSLLGQELFSPFDAAFMTPALMGVTFPAMGAARTSARQMQSNTHARGIHQSMVIYAQGNNGVLPDDIWVLVEGQFFTPDYAISPHAPQHIQQQLARFHDMPEDQQKQWIRQNASYVLIPSLTDDFSSTTVAVFERPDHSQGDRIAVAFNDNHTRMMDVHEARQIIEQQTGQTLEQLIERQQNLGSQ